MDICHERTHYGRTGIQVVLGKADRITSVSIDMGMENLIFADTSRAKQLQISDPISDGGCLCYD